MNQGDAASAYLQRVCGGTGEGLALEWLTGTQAAREIHVLHNRVRREVREPAAAATAEDHAQAAQAFAALVENQQGNWLDISNSARKELADRLMAAITEAEAAGDQPFIGMPPRLARELWPAAAVLRTEARRGRSWPLPTGPTP